MTTVTPIPGSFRDPAGRVFESGGLIYRGITARADQAFQAVRPVLESLVVDNRLVAFSEAAPSVLSDHSNNYARVIEHPKLPFISLPYEWPFRMLQKAAIFHLDLHIDLLNSSATLTDASAYNIQFDGAAPIFIDHLSIRPYKAGEYWMGHRQFCEQFLYPLLLRAWRGIPHHAWYRGELEGIPGRDLCAIAPWYRLLAPHALAHVFLPVRMQQRSVSPPNLQAQIKTRPFPLPAFIRMLKGLRNWISLLRPSDTQPTTWSEYSLKNTYSAQQSEDKHRFVAEFVAQVRPNVCVDLGCNTGDYSLTALSHGAGRIIGLDTDLHSLDQAFHRAESQSLKFTPIYVDARNPPPNQGWRQQERESLERRLQPNAIIALAFEHHLAIAHNAPLIEVVNWITAFADHGVIEFVPKEDPTIQRMLALREDIFEDYSEASFVRALQVNHKIIRTLRINNTRRVLFHYGP